MGARKVTLASATLVSLMISACNPVSIGGGPKSRDASTPVAPLALVGSKFPPSQFREYSSGYKLTTA